MLNMHYDKDKAVISLEKYLDSVDFSQLSLSGSKKSYSVGYDRIEFISKEGVKVKGALTLYSPKDDYEEWKNLRASASQQDKNQKQADKGNIKKYTIKELQLMLKDGLITQKFIETIIAEGKVLV